MADDGMLLNFDLSASTVLNARTAFKGGKWKDRLAAKKVAKHREMKSLGGGKDRPKATREIFDERMNNVEREEYIGPSTSARPAKRQRVNEDFKEPAGRNSSTAAVISGKLPPGSISTGLEANAVKKFSDNEAFDSKRNVATAAVISGKLPPGSISSGGNTNNLKKFTEDEEDYSPARIPASASEISRNISRDSLSTGRSRGGHFGAGKSNGSSSGGKPAPFVSSLFTFNPAAKTTFEEPAEVSEPVQPSNAPLSDEFSTFINLGMSRRLATHLGTKLEMKAPTAIQKAAIPQLIKDDSDAFIQAETGSGKTLAYLLPIVERIMAMSAKDESNGAATDSETKENQVHRTSGLFAIVLAPTRELCKQISMVLDKLLRCAPWIVGTTVIGGESKKSEKARLRKGVNILIATPGRLADHLDNTEVLNVSTVRWLVLDEGDRLMELGFEEEIKGIVERIRRRALVVEKKTGSHLHALPTRRVTVLCSATMKMNVQKLGEISLKDAVHIKADPSDEEVEKSKVDGVDAKDGGFSAPAQLQQSYAIVPAKQRLVTLAAVLKRAFARRGSVMKAIVFISCADSVDFHFTLFSRPLTPETDDLEVSSAISISKSDLTKDTIAAATTFSNPTNSVTLHKLHGSLAQNIRTATLKSFTDSKSPCILICTDVASRGLDLPNVDYVVEYDPPFSADDHLHRIGRTARAGRSGRAMIFLLPAAEELYIPILARSSPGLTSNTADDLLRKGFGGTGHEWEDRATEWQLDVERWAQDSPRALEMARRAFQSHIRAYATHVAAERHVFDMQSLHLGHLAKAFALRDRPGSIRVPGLRPEKMTRADKSVAMRKKAKRERDGVQSGDESDRAPEGERVRKQRKERRDAPIVEGDDAAKRMKKKMMEHMASASEFNIG